MSAEHADQSGRGLPMHSVFDCNHMCSHHGGRSDPAIWDDDSEPSDAPAPKPLDRPSTLRGGVISGRVLTHPSGETYTVGSSAPDDAERMACKRAGQPDGPTWHLWPFCTIREALRRWRTRTAGTDSFLASPSRRLTTPAHPDLDPQVSPPARVQSPDGAT